MIGAHPDDIEVGALGTLLKYRDDLDKLYCYVATLGGEGDASNEFPSRKSESEKALGILSPDYIFWLNRIGLKMEDYHFEVGRIESIIKKCAINLVLTLSPHDTHQDHRLMSEITITALRRALTGVLFYATPSINRAFSPTLYVDIGNYLALKLSVLKLHETQASKSYMRPECLEAFHSDASAILRGMRYVERFEIERIFH